MRKPVQKPMIGAVSKPKPTTPAPQEPATTAPQESYRVEALPAPRKPIDPEAFKLFEEKMREIQSRPQIPSTRPVPSTGMRGSKLEKDILRGATNPPQSVNPSTGEIAASRGISEKPSFKDKFKNPTPPPMNEDERLRKMEEASNSGNMDEYYRLQGLTPPKMGVRPVPNPQLSAGRISGESPVRTISPLQQFQQNQQRLYQTQPASQQMQAPQAEPVQPAAQEMQSAAPEAPAQDNSAIDAQIAQLQQQIAQLQSQKK